MTDQLIAALMQFTDKRGHWPGCPQSKRGVRSTFDRHGAEVLRPCSPKCRRARQAIETAGGAAVQQIGSPLRTDRSDDWYRAVYRHCTLTDPARPIHQPGCRHERGAA